MNLHQILKTVPPEYHAIARHYVRQFELAGVPEDKIDHLIQWGVAYQGSGNEAEILSSFRSKAARLGLSDDVTSLAADLGLEAREQINSGKFVPEPIAADDTTQLLVDIRRYRQQWPDEYNQDAEMQKAELALLSASMGEKPSAQSALPAPASDAEMRIKEIRQLRRDDWHAYESNPALQREELGLIEAQLASQRQAEAPAQQTVQPVPADSGIQGEINGSV